MSKRSKRKRDDRETECDEEEVDIAVDDEEREGSSHGDDEVVRLVSSSKQKKLEQKRTATPQNFRMPKRNTHTPQQWKLKVSFLSFVFSYCALFCSK